MDNAAERLEIIRDRIARAQRRFGPPPEHVELVAVSKTFDAEAIRPFLDAGPAGVRREPGAGGQGQMARSAGVL